MTIHNMTSMSGQPVVAIDSAEEIGTVKHFVVSSDVGRVERLHIDGRKKKALFAEWRDLESFGVDRVMVNKADAPSTSDDDRDLSAARGEVNLIGSRVLDTTGFEHGTVADASFDADTGEITGVTTTEGDELSPSSIRSLGTYALVAEF